VRIERLWVDVTAQVGSFWADIFTELELRYGLNINNIHHIWLLHYLFLTIINQQLAFFAESWNQHRIQIRDGPNRSPADLFGFDMFVHGIRGHQLSVEDDLDDEELEVYGVDWEGLRDEQLLRSQRQNNSANEGWSSWVGRAGPPENLNEVSVSSPSGILHDQEVAVLGEALELRMENLMSNDTNITDLWVLALGHCRAFNNNFM
jgi:hypothetical protein